MGKRGTLAPTAAAAQAAVVLAAQAARCTTHRMAGMAGMDSSTASMALTRGGLVVVVDLVAIVAVMAQDRTRVRASGLLVLADSAVVDRADKDAMMAGMESNPPQEQTAPVAVAAAGGVMAPLPTLGDPARRVALA